MLRGKSKLMRDGAQGEAIVLREQRRGAGTRDWRQYIDARLDGGDGSVVEFSGHIPHGDLGGIFLEVGDTVPVRYDPADHRQIVIDTPRVRAQTAARQRGGEPIPAAGAGVAAPAPGAASQPLTPDEVAAALDQMADLGELRHGEALSDAQYEAEKSKLQDLVWRRASAAITEAEFAAENALRLAGLPSSSTG
jgi:hypothetical protein